MATSKAEVERVARLMHAEFNRCLLRRRPGRTDLGDFDTTAPATQEAYLAVAAAVIADLCPSPAGGDPFAAELGGEGG